MHEDLFPYYEEELLYLRKFGVEFADNYPGSAAALKIDRDRCLDPHVERLLEGFALLTGRIRKKLEDEFPELTQSLLEMIYPHFLAPIPPVGIVQFQVDPQAVKLTSNYRIPKETILNTIPINGVSCCFRTCYPVDLQPLAIESAYISAWHEKYGPEPNARWQAQAVLNITIKALSGLTLGEIAPHHMRFFLAGAPLCYRLYELLDNHCVRIEICSQTDSQVTNDLPVIRSFLSSENLTPAGFRPQENLLPYPQSTFAGYRLLQEFFAFPEKFLFYDLHLENSIKPLHQHTSFTIRFYLTSHPGYAHEISQEHFALGCTPVINLFKKQLEPFKTDPAKREYHIVPEVNKPQLFEVYSLDKVSATNLETGKIRTLEPFYHFRHTLKPELPTYWYTRFEPGFDNARECYLNLCSLGFEHFCPAGESISIEATCSNRNKVSEIKWYEGDISDFAAEDIPLFGPIKALVMMGETIRNPLGRDDEFWNSGNERRYWRGGHWRLLSHLSLNYLSIERGGIEALQALLQLYDVKGEVKSENSILALTDLQSRPINCLIDGALCRGLEIELTIDPTKFKESSYYLLTAILDRFFAIYASLNSFTRLKVVDNTEKRKVIKQWPIRAGEQAVI